MCLLMTMNDFPDWLRKELEKRNWSQADLARRSGISAPQITRVLSGERSFSSDSLLAIAKAFKLPPEHVFQAAGILPPKSEEDKLIEQIIALTEGLSEESKKDIYEYARMRSRIDEEKARYDAAKNRKPRQAGT